MGVPTAMGLLRLTVELDRESDGRWIAEVPEIAGVIVYGASQDAAIAAAKGLALSVIGERLSRGEDPLTGFRSEATPSIVVGFKGIVRSSAGRLARAVRSTEVDRPTCVERVRPVLAL